MNDKQKTLEEMTLEEILSAGLTQTQQRYADVVAKYYGDPDYKAKMDADPAAVLRAEGFEFPDGVEVRLLLNTPERLYILMPRPSEYEHYKK